MEGTEIKPSRVQHLAAHPLIVTKYRHNDVAAVGSAQLIMKGAYRAQSYDIVCNAQGRNVISGPTVRSQTHQAWAGCICTHVNS